MTELVEPDLDAEFLRDRIESAKEKAMRAALNLADLWKLQPESLERFKSAVAAAVRDHEPS